MASYVDELSLKLTAKDEMSSRLKGLRKELGDVERSMAKTRAELENTGSPEAAAELRKLEQQWIELTQAQAKNRKEQAANEAAMKRLRAQAELSQTTAAKLGRAWTKTANVFSNDLVAGMSAAALFMGGRKFLNAFAEAEAMQAQLELSYRKFPQAANLSIDALRDYNDELMRSTGADDDALAAAEGMLMRFGLTASQIRTLIPLVNDLSIAKGVSLTDGATAVGKAIQGQTRALKDVGIVYKATGDASTDLANIQALLTEKVGGTALAFGQMTEKGKMQRLSAQFGNLQEDIGGQLVPALDALVGVTEPAMELFSGLPGPVKQTGVAAAFLGSAALIATPRVIMLKAAMTQANIAGGSLKSGLRNVGSFMLGPWGVALAAGSLALGHFVNESAAAESRIDTFRASIDATTGALNRAGVAKVAETLATDISASDWQVLAKYGVGLDQVTAAIVGGESAWRSFNDRINMARVDLDLYNGDRGLLSTVQNNAHGLRSELDRSRSALDAAGRAAAIAGVKVDEFGNVAEDTADAINPLTRAMNRFSHSLDVHDALVAWKKAQEDFIKKPSAETATAAARAYDAVTKTYKQGGAAQARFVQSNSDEMVAIIEKAPFSEKFKANVTDSLILANAEGVTLMNTLDQVARLSQISTRLSQISSGAVQKDARLGRWNGGPVYGPGTTTSDSVPAMLSRGEWVVRASSVAALEQQFGRGVMPALNNADRTRPPLIRTEAPRPVAPRVLVNAGARIGQMTTQVTATGQIDYELAQRRTARKMLRESRARTAGSRS